MFKQLFKVLFLLVPILVISQKTLFKEVNHQYQTWISLNNTLQINEQLSFLADFHSRRTDFLNNENFYFVRFGAGHTFNNKVFLAAGYAHMWLAPSKPEWNTFSNENRCYQQAQSSSKIGNISVLQRIRNEQRWQEKIVNDQKTGDSRFTNRVRYLLSLNIPIFKKSTMPTLVISDEILFHFGKEVVYNTFDQNRIFIGIKQSINPKLSFDFGYMNLYQQKYSGNQYDSNHTLRLFFYYNTSVKSLAYFKHHESGDE